MKVTLLENGIQNGVKEHQDRRLHYNVEILNAVVLYLGTKGIEACQKNEETGVLIFDPKAPTMILLSALNAEFDIEGLLSPDPISNLSRPLSLLVKYCQPTSFSEQPHILFWLRNFGVVFTRRRPHMRANHTGFT